MQPNPDVHLLALRLSLWNLSMLKWKATMNWLHPNLPKGSCYTLEYNFRCKKEDICDVSLDGCQWALGTASWFVNPIKLSTYSSVRIVPVKRSSYSNSNLIAVFSSAWKPQSTELSSEVGATKAKRKTEAPCQTTCLGWNLQEGTSRTDRVWGNHGCAVKCFWDSHQLTTFVYPNHIPRLSCFQQDNNQKYTSHLASSFIEEQGIHWSKNPPE